MAVTINKTGTSKLKELLAPKDHGSQGDLPSKKMPASLPAKIVQEILPPKKSQSAAPAIEKLSDEQAALAMMDELLLDQAANYFKLGGVLQVMKEKGWYAGEATFRDLCERVFGFAVRKAEYLIRIYNFLVKANLAWDDVRVVGWTKLRELCGKVDPEALPGWLENAKTMTVLELRDAVKAANGGGAAKLAAEKTSTKIFKPYPDQAAAIEEALEKAKLETGTKFDTVALEHVATSYLSGPLKPPKTPSPDAVAAWLDKAFAKMFHELGIIAALDLVEKADPESDPEGMVVEFLKETGEKYVQHLFELAFPKDPDPESLV